LKELGIDKGINPTQDASFDHHELSMTIPYPFRMLCTFMSGLTANGFIISPRRTLGQSYYDKF
jgi:hypothetical protein